MPISPSAPSFMREHWDAAVRHAGLENDDDLYLLAVPGAAPVDGNKAASYPRDRKLYDEEDDLLRGGVHDEANRADVRPRHRIAIYSEIDVRDPVERAIFAAKLRHEVRHAEQRDRCGQELFDVDEYANDVLAWKVGGLPKGAMLYGLKPIELDANAAAAAFLRDVRPEEVEAVLEGEEDQLARSNTPPGALEDLWQRLSPISSCSARLPRIQPGQRTEFHSSSGCASMSQRRPPTCGAR